MSSRSHVTAHVLDAAGGMPARGVSVTLVDSDGNVLADRTTDGDGRVSSLGPDSLAPGVYRIVFGTGDYFRSRGLDTFYPRVDIAFEIAASDEHYHVPLLLSPFAFTTYRGS